MRKTKAWVISIFLLCVYAIQVHAGVMVGDQAPNFSTTILDGKQVSLQDDYVGKTPVLLVFWATWCPNCQREIPLLNQLYKEIGERLSILAINLGVGGDSIAEVRTYKKEHDMKYPIIFDEESRITKAYEVFGTPTQIIVGVNGTILYRAIDIPTMADIKARWDILTQK
jgi:peroxiredoxin